MCLESGVQNKTVFLFHLVESNLSIHDNEDVTADLDDDDDNDNDDDKP